MRHAHSTSPLAAAAAAVAAAAGCGEVDDRYALPWDVAPPVALAASAAFVERTNGNVFLIDPADLEAPPRVVPAGRNVAAAVRREGQDELLVLSRGERGSPGVPAEPAALTVVPADGSRPVRRATLGTRFDAIAQSPDGRFLVAHFIASGAARPGQSQGDLLLNPNQIAIVDLATDPPSVTPRTVRSFGSVPTGVVFSPGLPIAGEGDRRPLAVILAENYVTLIDLANRERSEITVPLTLPNDRRSFRPQQVLFEVPRGGSKEAPAVYVRAEGSDDVHALRLGVVPEPERAERGGHDFFPSLSLLGAGSRPADMALFDTPDGPRLLVVASGSRDAFVIDARSSRTTRIPLEAPATRILVFEAAAPGDPQARRRALLLGPGTESRSAFFLDLDRIEEQRTRNLDSRTIGAQAVDVRFFPERGLALIVHGQGFFSVLDLARRTVAPIFASAAATGLVLGPPPTDKVWLGLAKSELLGFLGLRTLETGQVRLDAPVAAVLPLGPGRDGRARVVVQHPGVAGHVTVLDAEAPDRATARSAAGFLLTDLLERGDR